MNRAIKLAEPIMLIAVPAALLLCAIYQVENTALLTIAVAIAGLVPFFMRFEISRPRPRDIMPIVVLAAIAAAGRIIFAPFPNIKPVSAIVIVSALCFGKQSGFLTGALAALASNMFFGQGPWTPWQMYSWGLIGYLAGVFNSVGVFRKNIFVYIYGFVSALIYGFILDSYYIVGFIYPVTLQSAIAGYLAGLPFSMVHAAATVVFLVPILGPWKKALERVKTKFGII